MEWRLLIRNETGTPYGAAHNATAHPDDGYLKQEMVNAITNLAIATASDRDAIAQLTYTVKRIMVELVTVKAKLFTDLQTQHDRQGGCVGQGRERGHRRRHGASAPTQTGAVVATRTKEQDLEPPIHYC